MKVTSLIGRFMAMIMAFFFSLQAFAQDNKIDVNITKDGGGGGGWYTQPWVWIVGAAVFILLLVALTRGRRD
jgi:ABC-type Fe3+-siderophore transport system permease subunit